MFGRGATSVVWNWSEYEPQTALCKLRVLDQQAHVTRDFRRPASVVVLASTDVKIRMRLAVLFFLYLSLCWCFCFVSQITLAASLESH